jgi:NAD(P)-dependent dehydrogenase (short-subunit alcohol dehydrogenase family)
MPDPDDRGARLGPVALIGASGRIGRAMREALEARGATVHAFSRSAGDPAQRVDITKEDTIAAAAAAIPGPLDLVFVSTGILHTDGVAPEKSLKALDPVTLGTLFAVNTIGPALVAKHFVPKLRRDGRSVFAALSARVGSIGDNRLGGWYGYRASKAALNQMLRTLAIEVARTRPDAVILGLHPGTVATGLSRPFRSSGDPAVVTPDQAAAHLLAVIEGATPRQSGQVLAWDGSLVQP